MWGLDGGVCDLNKPSKRLGEHGRSGDLGRCGRHDDGGGRGEALCSHSGDKGKEEC